MDSEANHFTTIDYGVFGVMLFVSASIGVYFGYFDKQEKTTEEYLLGGRKMKTIPIAISLIASQLSALALMTLPAEMYAFGSSLTVVIFIQGLVALLINFVFIPIFYNNKIDNCYAYLEMRFSKAVRTVVTVSFILTGVLLLPIGSFVPSLAFSSVTGTNIHFINTIVTAVCVFYTMLGGIKAVVWTDVVQASVMLISLITIMILSIAKVGGFTEVVNRAVDGNRLHMYNTTFDLTTRQTIWNCFFGMLVIWGGYVGLNQSCVQRIVSLPSINHARRSIYLFCIGVMIILGINCFTGVIMYAHFYDCDPVKAGIVGKYDKMVPHFVQEVVGHLNGMPGLFISSVFSASLSTISANLNSLAGIIYSDYIRPLNLFKHSDAAANLTMKLTIVAMGIYCVLSGFLVEKVSSIFQVANTIFGMTCGASFGVFLLGMLYPRAHRKAALWSTIISMLCLFWIITGSQVLIAKGDLKYEPLPTRIDGCQTRNITVIMKNQLQLEFDEQNSTNNALVQEDPSFSIYRISFSWYPVIGVLIVWIIGIPLSHILGSASDLDKLNPDLIATQAKFLIPKRLLHVQLQMSPVPIDSDYQKVKEKCDSRLVNGENERSLSNGNEDERNV